MIRYVVEDTENIDAHTDLLYRHLKVYISKEELTRDILFCFENGRAVGAYVDDVLIGSVVGVYTPFFEKFHVAHLAVEPEYRREGIGRELMERIVPEGADISVHLNQENPKTLRFYEKLGFTKTHLRFQKFEE